MIRWIERGLLGESRRATLWLYCLDALFLGGICLLVAVLRGQSAAFYCLPTAAVALVTSQKVLDLLVPSQLLRFRAKEVVVFYSSYAPKAVLGMLASGALAGVACDIHVLGSRRQEFALLLAQDQTAIFSPGEESRLQAVLVRMAERALGVSAGFTSLFLFLSVGIGYLLLSRELVDVAGAAFHLLAASLVFALYVTFNVVNATFIILMGRRRVRAGECELHRYGSGGVRQLA